ncbi:cobyrinate a,c-diamide synthase [Terriglobus sp. 2YAB30_2]|uniref:cobyrinate a,c-diamide synthase n=1 Tax=unclassified Terriglobus TaxID=2628988 RepID=UPI003F9B14B9
MKGFLIAGTASGVGKTTVTLALLSIMRRREMTVQPFKAGPDFLDAGHHTRIAGRAARNIDTWMLSIDANQDVLREAAIGAQALVVEGMMGLFDGKDGTQRGSSAEIAKLFGLPVVLVLDAAKTSHSIAATVLGFELFDPDLRLAGVILNRVASQRHFEMLRSSIASSCRTAVLGWLPQERTIAIPERHLGLRTSEEHYSDDSAEKQLERLASIAEQHLDLEALLSLECGFDFKQRTSAAETTPIASVRIGVARDKAFSFYYEDNLDLLRASGAEIVPFSPLHDAAVPEDLDGLYLGGGYPELYAEALSANQTMLQSIRNFASSGKPVYAECGGMIYLSRSIAKVDGTVATFAGVLPFTFEMTGKLVQFGYVSVELTRDCLLGRTGTTLRGHSFHYSRILETSAADTCYQVQYSLSKREEAEGYLVGNVLASYIHLHFRTSSHVAKYFVEAACSARDQDGITL